MPGTPMAKSHSLFSVNSFTCRGVINCSARPLRSSGGMGGIWSGASSPCRRRVGGRPTFRWRSDAPRCTSWCSTALKLKVLGPPAAAAPAGAAGATGSAIAVDAEERLARLHGRGGGRQDFSYHARHLALLLVYDIHRLAEAQPLFLRDPRAYGDIRLGPRLPRPVESPDP